MGGGGSKAECTVLSITGGGVGEDCGYGGWGADWWGGGGGDEKGVCGGERGVPEEAYEGYGGVSGVGS